MSAKDEKIIEEAKTRFKLCQERESYARQNFKNDMRFGYGDSVNLYQWDQGMVQARASGSKPSLTENRTKLYCEQIVNDARQNKSDIMVRPVGDGASYDSAQIFMGVIRHIENISMGQTVYMKALHDCVFGGWGYWIITTDYANDETFDQEIFVKRIPDALNVFLDVDIENRDGSDAKYGFVFSDVSKEQFKKDYPKYEDLFGSQLVLSQMDYDGDNWVTENHVRVADYYRVEESKDTLHYLPDGTTMRESEVEDTAALREISVNSRPAVLRKVMIYKIAGSEIIDKTEWAGKYVPIIRVVATETVIDGQLDRISHVRGLIDSQRALNYYISAGAEYVALQSKTPYVGPAEAFEGNEVYWRNANTTNYAYLPYKAYRDDGETPIPKPEREPPPVFAGAYLDGIKVSVQNLELASGQPAATFGEPSGERSGKAINERTRNAANATFHFVDGLATALTYCGKQLIDLIPKIYDTERVMKINFPDGTESTVKIDPNMPQAHMPVSPQGQPAQGQMGNVPDPEQADLMHVQSIFNPNVGSYSVTSDVGPSYATRRQEAFNALSTVLEQNPQLVNVIGDLWAKFSDFPGADEIAVRMRNMVPPQALGIGPSQQEQQLQQMLGQQHQVIQNLTNELMMAKSKSVNTEADREIDDYRAQTDRMKVINDVKAGSPLEPIVMQQLHDFFQTDLGPMIAKHLMSANILANQAELGPAQGIQPTQGNPQ